MYHFNEDIPYSICRGEHVNIVRIALSSEELALIKILNLINLGFATEFQMTIHFYVERI